MRTEHVRPGNDIIGSSRERLLPPLSLQEQVTRGAKKLFFGFPFAFVGKDLDDYLQDFYVPAGVKQLLEHKDDTLVVIDPRISRSQQVYQQYHGSRRSETLGVSLVSEFELPNAFSRYGGEEQIRREQNKKRLDWDVVDINGTQTSPYVIWVRTDSSTNRPGATIDVAKTLDEGQVGLSLTELLHVNLFAPHLLTNFNPALGSEVPYKIRAESGVEGDGLQERNLSPALVRDGFGNKKLVVCFGQGVGLHYNSALSRGRDVIMLGPKDSDNMVKA